MRRLIVFVLVAVVSCSALLAGGPEAASPVGIQGAVGGKSVPMKVDPSTYAQTTIDYSHYEIHAGSHFKGGYSNQDLDENEVMSIVFMVPAGTKYSHWTLTAQSTGGVTVNVYEGATLTATGTAVTVWNRNRNSTTVNTMTIGHTPTVTASGTKMVQRWIGGTGFKESISGEHRGDAEFVLKADTYYLVEAIADADNTKVAIGGDWYEHTDKN